MDPTQQQLVTRYIEFLQQYFKLAAVAHKPEEMTLWNQKRRELSSQLDTAFHGYLEL